MGSKILALENCSLWQNGYNYYLKGTATNKNKHKKNDIINKTSRTLYVKKATWEQI